MPQSIPKGIAASHVLLDLPDLDAGVEHPFGAPTGYELVHQGKRYPPKAVIGLAFRHLGGAILPPEQFSGEAPGQSNFVLRGLGFTVEMKGEAVAEPAETKEWTAEEVSLIVADYFVLLRRSDDTHAFASKTRSVSPLNVSCVTYSRRRTADGPCLLVPFEGYDGGSPSAYGSSHL